MKKIVNIHNKTKELDTTEMPYNEKNIIISEEQLTDIFNKNGLEDIKYHNIDLYRNAFVHKSYCTMKNEDFANGNLKCPFNCVPLQEMSYERLEYLGDSILGMVVASYLYERYPDQNEGFLSKLRTKIVNGKMLGFLSEKIGFSKYAIISKQVEEANGRNNYKIMEDIFEAFIGALYIDYQSMDDVVTISSNPKIKPISGAGYFIAEKWIIYVIENYIDLSELIRKKTNYKDMLVNHMQHNLIDIPRYYEINITSTKENTKIFTYCIKDKNNSIIATSSGITKKEAENNASKEALIYYGIEIDKED